MNSSDRIQLLAEYITEAAAALLDPGVADAAKRNALRQQAHTRLVGAVSALVALAQGAEFYAAAVEANAYTEEPSTAAPVYPAAAPGAATPPAGPQPTFSDGVISC